VSVSECPEREWFAIALDLSIENAEWRRICTSLFLWLAEREELLALARAEIDRRWPESS
jgi:hypothetical protein